MIMKNTLIENEFDLRTELENMSNEEIISYTPDDVSGQIIAQQNEDEKDINDILSLVEDFDITEKIPEIDIIGGLFYRGYLNILAGAAKVGKTLFLTRFISDLSLGGTIFGGLATNEPPRKIFGLVGELGRDGMILRAQQAQWKSNKENIKTISSLKASMKGQNVMLNGDTMRKAMKRICETYKPDIIFIDSLITFFNGNEKNNEEIRDVLIFLASLAYEYKCAVVVVQHIRKRLANERLRPLDLDDVIGGSAIARLAARLIGIEKDNLLEGSWFTPFNDFSYKTEKGFYGGIGMKIELDVPHRDELEQKNIKQKQGTSTAEKIMTALRLRGKEGISTNELTKAVGNKDTSLKMTLSRLTENGEIKRLKRGFYILPDFVKDNSNENETNEINEENKEEENFLQGKQLNLFDDDTLVS